MVSVECCGHHGLIRERLSTTKVHSKVQDVMLQVGKTTKPGQREPCPGAPLQFFKRVFSAALMGQQSEHIPYGLIQCSSGFPVQPFSRSTC